MTKLKLTGEEAKEIVYEEAEGWETIYQAEDIKNGRWDLLCMSVCMNVESGRFYIFHYSRCATEMQESQPYEYDKFVEVEEAELVEVTRKEWTAKACNASPVVL